jgi:hypothetical protein
VPWRPSEPGEVPTLGWEVIDWITEYLAAPDRAEYEPFVLYPEQEDFVLRFYELDPTTGKRRRRRGVISRPRGWGKSPFLAALACAEALGPVVSDGWDADGQPVGKPWAEVRTPLVQIAAVSEDQTKNTWSPLLEMLSMGPACDEYPGLEPLDTFVNLPRGKIEPKTSNARSTKGNRAVFAVLDQTEEWVKSNGGLNLFQKMKNNAAKIGGSFVESPNAFIPGQGSVAEESAAFWAAIREGRARDDSLYYDHREAPGETDLTDRKSLIRGLRIAYGDSSAHPKGCVIHKPACPPGHVDLDILVSTIWDPTSDEQESRSDFLNQITHASDSWIAGPDWTACADPSKEVAEREVVTLGFDGSRKRAKGKTDATALIGCRVSDGHVFAVQVWEHPDGQDEWSVPVAEVEAEVKRAFARYNVVGFYADPSMWETYVAGWEARYGRKLKVGPKAHPIEWWTSRIAATELAFDQFREAIVSGDMTHDGSSALARHMLNARRRERGTHMVIAKEHPASDKKIDAAYAATLAWQARLDAVAKGLGKTKQSSGRVILLDD